MANNEQPHSDPNYFEKGFTPSPPPSSPTAIPNTGLIPPPPPPSQPSQPPPPPSPTPSGE